MGLFNKVKDFFGYNDEYYDEEYEADDYNEPDMTLINNSDESDRFGYSGSRSEGGTSSRSSSNNVVNFQNKTKFRVVLVMPKSFNEADVIADHLNDKRTVLLNLESAEKDQSRRLLDFLSGVAYANGGEIKRSSNCTYLITPYNVDIQGEELGEAEDNGIFFGG